MNHKMLLSLLLVPLILTGCIGQSNEPELTLEELYYNFGHTSNSINYAKDNKSAIRRIYSEGRE